MLKFFWRQPGYQSGLDTLLKEVLEKEPSLDASKEAGIRAMQRKEPFSWDIFYRQERQNVPEQ